MIDEYRDKIIKIKNLFNQKEKQYYQIQTLLIQLFEKKKYKFEEYEKLGRFLIENQKELCEIRDKYIEMKKTNDENIKKEEKEKEKEENLKNIDYKDKDKDKGKDKEIDTKMKQNRNDNYMDEEKNQNNQKINKEELNGFFTLITYMKEFPEKIIDNKNHFILYNITKEWMDGFIGKIYGKIINEQKFKFIKYKKEKKKKKQYNYETLYQLYKSNDIAKCYSILQSKSFEDDNNKEEQFKFINFAIKIYNDLTENQKSKIKEKYLTFISDEELSAILFLNFDNIFKIEKDILKYLSGYIEGYTTKLKIKNIKNDNINENNNKMKKINRDNVCDILLIIYKEYMHLKNKQKSYISLNKNNIEDKFLFFLIINIITYIDVFITGENLIKFLYIKYWYQFEDLQKLIVEKNNIKKEIIIYTENQLKQNEKIDKNLEDEDLEEQENEDNLSSYGYEIDKFLKNNLLKFIPEKYFKMYSEVLKKINNFYRIPYPLNSLVNFDNIIFTFNIIDLYIFYEKYNGNNKNEKIINKKYKENLLKLENNIFDYYKSSTLDYVNINEEKILIGYRINKTMKDVFNDLKIYLNKNLSKSFKYYKDYEINYIPFGSVTQFLSGENGDIDLFLVIKRISHEKIDNDILNKNKTELLQNLYSILKRLDKDISFHQTNRLCLFSITFREIKIDINVYGVCSYYGEILLREYSLLDFRFPMLVIYIKYIIGKKQIKNTEKEKIYINSFAWTNILLVFLQDILDPPLFPRLLNEDNKKQINIKVGGGVGKDKKKELEDEFFSQNTRSFNVIKYPENNMKEIEQKFYDSGKAKKDIFYGKNQMCVSEILLKFVQFIGYYFNYKYIIVNNSYEYQSFMPKTQKNKINDEYTKYFFRKCDEEEDLLLIREPFDYTYNPCKTVSSENLEHIKAIFREIYINILEKGEI